ncbi:MAG: DUF4179 domain-containing protein [Faecousia sp.]
MTGKDMLGGIQNLDADLIEEAEFGTFQKKRTGFSGRKKLLFVLAATLIMGTMTAAAVFTRWSTTMQLGGGVQPSEQIKQQAEQSGLSVIPTETKGGKQEPISATDNGITVTLAQTVMDQYGGKVIFRIEGLELEEGQAPWAWWDYQIDGEDVHIGWGSQFFNGMKIGADGNPVYVKNGKPIPRVGENQELLLDYQLSDGSIEFSIDFAFPQDGESFLGKEMTVTFTGFGIQGEKFEDEDIMTVPGNWELRWTLEGSTQEPMKWTPNAEIGHWGVTLVEAEIGQYSMKITYRIDEPYKDDVDFIETTGWGIAPAGIRLKDGTDIQVYGDGAAQWNPELRQYTDTTHALNTILDPSQIAGMYFYAGYELNEQGYRVNKPYYYIPLE